MRSRRKSTRWSSAPSWPSFAPSSQRLLVDRGCPAASLATKRGEVYRPSTWPRSDERRLRAALREQRELDAGRAGVEDRRSRRPWHHATAFRGGSRGARCATSAATAQDARRVITESARLVRMIGTRAPSTMPAASAPARNDRLLASMLPASRSGTTSTLARPATGESIFLILRGLEADRVVERERAVEDAAGDLAAVGHLAQRRRLDASTAPSGLTVSIADRIATRTSANAQARARGRSRSG